MARITTQADVTHVEEAIQRALADESKTELSLFGWADGHRRSLTVPLARRIIACLRENPRLHTLTICSYDLRDDTDMLDVFRTGLPTCTAVTAVKLYYMNLGNEGLERLLPAFRNTSITMLNISYNNIQGQRGGEVIRDLLVGNNNVLELHLSGNSIGPEGAIGIGQGIAGNYHLQKLCLSSCNMGNDSLENLVLAMGELTKNNSLTHLTLNWNNIMGAEGGRLVTLLLQRFPALKELCLDNNNLGPLGARALAPGLTATVANNLVLESLSLRYCNLGNDGVMNLIPDGEVNRSLTILSIDGRNNIQYIPILSLASRCTNLDRLDIDDVGDFSPDQQRRLDLLLDRKRLVNNAQSISGSPFSVLFRAMEEAHHHEHGLSAIFVILQNDGEDLFYTALNRFMD